MKEELISVIVAIYNIERYLPRCLESIEHQTYQNLEIILVDDGSSDGSSKICDDFAATDSRCIVIHQKNHGLYYSRNIGQACARGKFLKFVDGDDYMHADTIRLLYEAITQDDGYDLAICDVKPTVKQDENIYQEIGEFKQTKMTQADLFWHMFDDTSENKVNLHYVWNKLYRKELSENIFTNDYIRAQDVDYNIRYFLKVDQAIWIHCTLNFYVQRADSLMKHPKTTSLDIPCLTDIYFLNYLLLSPEEKVKYGHYLLNLLYFTMIYWKNRVFNSKERERVFWICQEYKNNTIWDFWKNREINLKKKITYTLLFHCPWLSYILFAYKKW